jgi:hypothetical protein
MKKQVWVGVLPDGRWHACESENEAMGFACLDGTFHRATLEWPAAEPRATHCCGCELRLPINRSGDYHLDPIDKISAISKCCAVSRP